MPIFSKKLFLSFVSVLLFVSIFITSASAETNSKFNQNKDLEKREQQIEPNVHPSPDSETRENHYPIVLVHGFTGWGRDEMHGLKYWGGLNDLQQELRNHDYMTYTAAVGPFSSNWDRAVELYYQIKGGTVDYGKTHAEKHGHDRYGRTYPGLYPEWGEENPETGELNKTHLLGHSMGGQTVRVLTQLLENGSKEERDATPANDLSPLFNDKEKSWVSSVLTISTPHDGTTLTDLVDNLIPHAQQIIASMAMMGGSIENPTYDFKLDQWGLKRRPGESFAHYNDRVADSNIWEETKDTAQWDLSPEGAKELNDWVNTQPDVYYFSVATEQTYEKPYSGHHAPELLMNPLFYSFSYYMGSHTRSGEVEIDSSWWENDGVVNTNSMDGPSLGSSDEILNDDEDAKIGKWNSLGKMNSFDHLDVIGYGVRNMEDWYMELAELLASLDN